MKKFHLGILVIVFILVLFLTPYTITYYHSQNYGAQKISDVAKELSYGESNKTKIVQNIVEWESQNMKWNTMLIYFWPFPPFVSVRQISPPASWVMIIKQGGCEEYAILFVDLAKAAGLEGRVIYNSAEDHVWAEVFINGSWIHVDPTRPFEEGYNNPTLYENGWKKQISSVYYSDSNGTKHDVTKTYTGTGKLLVQVLKDGTPMKNVTVYVSSRFLMETNSNYNSPLYSEDHTTNATGFTEFQLGGNNYTVSAQIGQIVGYKNEFIVTLEENSETNLTLNLDTFSCLIPPNVTILIMTLSIEIFVIFLFRKK